MGPQATPPGNLRSLLSWYKNPIFIYTYKVSYLLSIYYSEGLIAPIFVFLANMLLIFCDFPLPNLRKAVVLIVLTKVEPHPLTGRADTHGDDLVNQPIT